MARRDQPYLPLYIQDFLTDEKLNECSAASTGVYIRLMCLMHKSEKYGTILLKQKDKQSDNQIKNFTSKIAKQMPYSDTDIFRALEELIHENVLQINGDYLEQKRMMKDNEISETRSKSGSKGGKSTQKENKNIKGKADKNFAKAKSKANAEYESVIENEDEIVIKDQKKITSPSKPSSKIAEPFFIPARDLWFGFYKNVHPANGQSPSFDAVSGAKIKTILAKLKLKTIESEQEWNQENALNAFKHLLETAKAMKWLKDNFTLKNIDSQIDIIVQSALKTNLNGNATGIEKLFSSWGPSAISQG